MMLTDPLRDALGHLETHLGLVSSSLGKADPALALAFRTAAIKSFEYCYGLSLKAIERAVTDRSATPETVEAANFRTLIRMAWELGLVADREQWLVFRDHRNITAHTYDERKAASVVAVLPEFIRATRDVLERLEAHADAS